MNWKQEIIKLIGDHFKNLGIKYKSPNNLNECLTHFFNLQFKQISPVSRQVFKSRQFLSRNLSQIERTALQYIETKIKYAENLKYHLSKNALDPTKNDPLLNCWAIHHLHISDVKEKNSPFFQRTKNVLFAIFTDEQVFFIDVRPHGIDGEKYIFAKKELLEIVDNNWPQLLESYLAKDVIDITHNLSAEETTLARKKGLNTAMLKINGKIYFEPALGIMTSGDNIQVVRKADAVLRNLHGIFELIEKDPITIKRLCEEKCGLEISSLDVCLRLIDKWPFFHFYEQNSGLYLENIE
jgi:hypothetical protein